MTAAASAFAPASVGNVGVGFDILGHTIAGPGDRVTVRRVSEAGVRIVAIRGCEVTLPTEAERNTAGAALLALREAQALSFGFEIVIDKGIPYGSGMGGSAASAVAALIAANALLDRPLARRSLYPFALAGETVASGSRHGDNVGAMLLGGLVLSTVERLVSIPVPAGLHCALAHPHAVLETRAARKALEGRYDLSVFVEQSANETVHGPPKGSEPRCWDDRTEHDSCPPPRLPRPGAAGRRVTYDIPRRSGLNDHTGPVDTSPRSRWRAGSHTTKGGGT